MNRFWGKVARVHRIEPSPEPRSLDPNPESSQKYAEQFALYLKLVSDLFNSVECGVCNSIIYEPKGKFDESVLRANKLKHYSESPTCRPRHVSYSLVKAKNIGNT